MKTTLLTVALIIIQGNLAFPQNYMHNAGFEDRNLPSNPTNDDLENSYDFLEVWLDDSKEDYCQDEGTGTEYHVKLHSPDWFNTSIRPIEEYISGSTTIPVGHL